MSEQDNMDQLMQALNGHQVTDDQGQIVETETTTDSSPAEQTTVDDTTSVETPPESETKAPEAEETDEETPVEDETGKRYVPESRFKEVYGRQKQLERELQAMREQAPVKTTASKQKSQPIGDQKTAALENELLFVTLPQFNPDNPEHDPELDAMAVDIYKANEGQITKLQAARLAIQRASRLSKKVGEVRQEARTIKTLQSDQGITNRVTSRDAATPDLDKMSLQEHEAYLKSHGMWPE